MAVHKGLAKDFPSFFFFLGKEKYLEIYYPFICIAQCIPKVPRGI